MPVLPPIEMLSDDSGPEPSDVAEKKPASKAVAQAKAKAAASAAAKAKSASAKSSAKAKAKAKASGKSKSKKGKKKSPEPGENHEAAGDCSEKPAAESAPVRMKRPACATENASEIRVSQPYYYKSSNSWGLKIGKKQVIGVGSHRYDKDETRKIVDICRDHLLKGESKQEVEQVKAALLLKLTPKPKSKPAPKKPTEPAGQEAEEAEEEEQEQDPTVEGAESQVVDGNVSDSNNVD